MYYNRLKLSRIDNHLVCFKPVNGNIVLRFQEKITIVTGNKKLCKSYIKILFFQNVLVFTDLFYRYNYIRYSSTQIECDVMCVQYVQKEPPEVFFKDVLNKGVLKKFANFTGKHLCWSLVNKVAGLNLTNTYFEGHLWTTADQMVCN